MHFFYAHFSTLEEKLRNNLGTLLDLQRVDQRLMELASTRGDLPQKVDSIKSELEELKGILESKKKELKEVELESAQVILDMKKSKEKLEQYQEQLYQVSTNREYDAITHEIEVEREKIDGFELGQIELDDSGESLKAEIEEIESKSATLFSNLGAYEKDLKEKLSLTNREEENLRSQRKGLVSDIDRSMYGTYERVRKAKSGIAVVSVRRQACGGCFSSIPPQRVLEIRQQNKFITCEVCGRIIIWHEPETVS